MQLLVAHFEKGFVLRVQRAGVMFSYGHRLLLLFAYRWHRRSSFGSNTYGYT